MQNLLKIKANQSFLYNRKIRPTILLFVISLFWLQGAAQTYHSNFTNPTGNYSDVSPSGGACFAPTFTNASDVADVSLGNYASVSGLLVTTLSCTNTTYSIRAKLNFPGGTLFAPAGYEAGFRVRMDATIPVSLLQNNISIRTYLAGNLRQNIPGSSIAGISLLTGEEPVDLYFTSTLSFDEVELVFDTAILPIGENFDYRFYYAFGTVNVLPVTFGDLSAKIQSGRLQVDWTTLSETNNAKFIVQGSNDGKTWTDLGVVDSKAQDGRSATLLPYSFSREWSGAILAGFGILGLLLLPVTRSRLFRIAIVLIAVSIAISCAKETDRIGDFKESTSTSQAVYIRLAQFDKNGTTTYSAAVLAKK
ncbi:hypothetical protein [Pedobacter sp. ASV28]|uniref:hypothetical protein n=1 Tax=Pedobacter sp. ASV28 TaxID=2795123 RepID=UPI0018EC4633|nr:hypothetical protein [Pedobacter sp. ASV28]